MSTLRVAFLSALVLELSAAVATALVAVEVGLRLLAGHLGYETALLVLLLTPEAFLPLRAVGAAVPRQHGGRRRGRARLRDPGHRAAGPAAGQAGGPAPRGASADLRTQDIRLNGVTVAYPGRDRAGSGRGEPDDRAGGADRGHRAERRGQEHAARAAAALRRSPPRGTDPGRRRADLADARRRPWRAPDRLGAAAARTCSRAPSAANIALGQPGASRDAIAPGRRGWPARPSSSRPCRAGTTRRSGSAACGCPRASGSGSRWPGRSCGTRRCCCWTSPPPTWTRSAPGRSRTPSTRPWPTAPSCWSATAGAGQAAAGRRHQPGRTGQLVAGGRCLPGAARPDRSAAPVSGEPAGTERPGAAPAAAAAVAGPAAARPAAAVGAGGRGRHRLRRGAAGRVRVPARPRVPAPEHPGDLRGRGRGPRPSASGAGSSATSSGWPRTTSRSGSWPTSGWRSTGGWSGWPRPGWPRSAPATCWPG